MAVDTPVVDAAVLGGRYRLGSLLGAGGMAQVYEGWDERLARPVAVKLLRPDLAAIADLRRRFEFEARAAAGLTHRNVVSVYDAGDDNGQSYIVMERLSGESLADGIGHGPMDSAWLRRLALEVLAALGAAHAAGIVHRDIKPGNILLGPDGRAKVADFGIARVMEPDGSGEAGSADPAAALTGAGLVVGTPAYLAPERAMGEPATPQSDLYSLGVVLYEALTGRKPYAGVTPAAIAAAAVQGAVENPSLLRPDADPELVAVIGRAMALDPSHRYPAAAEMAADLRRSTPPPTAVMPVVTGVGLGSVVAPTVADSPAALAVPGGAFLAQSDPRGHLSLRTTSETDGNSADRRAWRLRRRLARSRGRTGLVLLGVAALAAAALALAFATTGLGFRAASSSTRGSPPGASPGTTVAANPNTATPGPEASSSATTAPAVGVNQSSPLGAALQNEAKRLARSKSTAAGPLAAGLNSVAAIADSNTRAAAAASLLDQTVQWFQDGRLTTSEYVVAAALLHNAGAPVPPPPTVKHRTGDTGGAGGGGG